MRLFSIGITRPDENVHVYFAGRLTPAVGVAPESARPAPQPIMIATTLEHPRRVTAILEEAGLKRPATRRWEKLFRGTAHRSTLERGHQLVIYRDPQTGALRGLRYDLNSRTSVIERSVGYGVVMASLESIPYVIRRCGVAFAVRGNFAESARRSGLPNSIIDALEGAFSGGRGFTSLRSGAAVRVIYDQRVSRDGLISLPDSIEAARVGSGVRSVSAFAFRDPQGVAHLYDSSGRALGRQFLRFPVRFQYISSGFSFHRYHPILHIYRPHLGVDLAARYGTPVKAIADGRVQYAGWCGELGRCVRLEHKRGLISVYGHLSRISGSVYRGGYVHMGQVIGNVGESGLATGPHLHFAIEREGRFVNPLTQHFSFTHSVSARMKPLFERVKHRYLAALDRLPAIGSHFGPVVEAAQPVPREVATQRLARRSVRSGAHRRWHRYRRDRRYRRRRARRAISRPMVNARYGAM